MPSDNPTNAGFGLRIALSRASESPWWPSQPQAQRWPSSQSWPSWHCHGPLCHTVTMRGLNSKAVSWLFGVRGADLPGYTQLRRRALSALPSPAAGSVLPTTNYVLGTTDIELLAAHQTPARIAKVALLRAARRAQRDRDRAEMAQRLLDAAKLAQPGKRFSMADAGLARAAAGVEQCDIPDKRRLRGEAREAARAEKATRVALPMSTLGKTRGNGGGRGGERGGEKG